MHDRPKLVYVAGPYRAPTPWGVEQNIRRAAKVAARVWEVGLVAVCPHLNSAHMEGVATDEQFLAGTLEILRRCDAAILVPGWERSAGTRAEIVEANRLGLPVFDPPGNSVAAVHFAVTILREWSQTGELPPTVCIPPRLETDAELRARHKADVDLDGTYQGQPVVCRRVIDDTPAPPHPLGDDRHSSEGE